MYDIVKIKLTVYFDMSSIEVFRFFHEPLGAHHIPGDNMEVVFWELLPPDE